MDGMHGQACAQGAHYDYVHPLFGSLTSTNLFTMRAALFLLAFAAVFVVASPSSDKGKKKKPAAPAATADPAASADAPAATV
ncbi:hypothetical protein BDN71DRAFT_1590132 [Pleurotus eryngii]|uniref:Uncharacterized protein n=1 Tax=Pleurotus eryngii TaxID=5323 RepID=A0A9P5ZV88_PLEER|nr:hypothetical protein BDN71DRAFT_1590132 [Pleurotus eryngii]